ncbi:hypothetical protein CXB51_010940 [Gossypium anomalum]|uniref:Retrotransposon gag protein n=1 Tax=Gossypium anomalum TaxID=47600 RepID=A0A8J6D6V4_9ROSI|nr:hypothetical protein CXB51_010940 [Gossypium anomalum]
MKPQGVTENQLKLRAFPFSLADSDREWLFYLPLRSVNTWFDMSRLFLDRFFFATRAAELKRDIALLQYFYEGFLPMEMKMINVASGGALVNMTPQKERELISTMAANSQQFRPITEPMRRIKRVKHSCAEFALSQTIQQTHDHPNLSYRSNPQFNQSYQQRPPSNQQLPPPKSYLETIMERLTNSTEKFLQKTEIHLQELDKQVSKLTFTVSRLESQSKLPSQTKPNPRHNVSAMTLMSRKVLEPVLGMSRTHDVGRDKKKLDTKAPMESTPPKSFAVPPPFPRRLVQCKKEREEKEILDTFRKVEINIPLLDVIKQIPRYAKFLKELCTSKRKLLGNENVSVGENVFVILQRKTPPKCKDQGGVLEDVLVKVNELIFPADFYIINMEDDNLANLFEIFLGRPFLSTA